MPWVTREVPPGSGRLRAVNEPAKPHPGAAPVLDCAVCGRGIGKGRFHVLIGPEPITADRLLCVRCMRDTRRLHARFYPDCDEQWHDLYDHGTMAASRAAAARLLGVWP